MKGVNIKYITPKLYLLILLELQIMRTSS